MCFISIPIALIATAAGAEIQARTAIIFSEATGVPKPEEMFSGRIMDNQCHLSPTIGHILPAGA
ncbi:MAG TPA: hypothetical protein VMB22_00320 [Verrucomicrobiae bacterium]|nr:hypothetical protein [Verrucomicrobiae bacterium]